MKLLRWGVQGAEKPGLLDPAGVMRDLSGVIPELDGAALDPEVLAAVARVAVTGLPVVAPGTRLGACVADVGKIVGVGLNYADHAAESQLGGLFRAQRPVADLTTPQLQPQHFHQGIGVAEIGLVEDQVGRKSPILLDAQPVEIEPGQANRFGPAQLVKANKDWQTMGKILLCK